MSGFALKTFPGGGDRVVEQKQKYSLITVAGAGLSQAIQVIGKF